MVKTLAKRFVLVLSALAHRLAILLLALCFTIPAVAQAVDAAKSKVTLALATEPPTLNSAVATDTIASFVLAHLMEGLLV